MGAYQAHRRQRRDDFTGEEELIAVCKRLFEFPLLVSPTKPEQLYPAMPTDRLISAPPGRREELISTIACGGDGRPEPAAFLAVCSTQPHLVSGCDGFCPVQGHLGADTCSDWNKSAERSISDCGGHSCTS